MYTYIYIYIYLLLTREIFWQHALLTFEPYGMNKRDDLYSSRTKF